jgi:hypothetical protein
MPLSHPHQRIIDAVGGGVAALKHLMARLTEYHGGPTATEHLLTGNIARVLVEQQIDGVTVECPYRRLVTYWTAAGPVPDFGGKRADIAVVNMGKPPTALIETKIRVTRFGHIANDVLRIVRLLSAIRPSLRGRTIGLVVFQISVRGRLNWYTADRVLRKALDIEARMQNELNSFRAQHGDFEFTWLPLQGADEGAVGREVEGDLGDPDAAWGERGHATRYHVLIVQAQ